MVKSHATDVEQEEKSRGGRPHKKDMKVPQVKLSEAIAFTRNAFDKVGMDHKSFSGMAQAMEVTDAFGKRAFGEMKDQYGLITREDDGAWHITDLGRRAATGDKSAVLAAFCKNEIMSDLYNTFKNRSIGNDFLIDHIKRKRYAYKAAEVIAEKFLDGMSFVAAIAEETSPMRHSLNVDSKLTVQNFLKLIQLQYALNPPEGATIAELAVDVGRSLGKDQESSLRTLGWSISNNRDDGKVLSVIVGNALAIMKDKYSEVLGNIESQEMGSIADSSSVQQPPV